MDSEWVFVESMWTDDKGIIDALVHFNPCASPLIYLDVYQPPDEGDEILASVQMEIEHAEQLRAILDRAIRRAKQK